MAVTAPRSEATPRSPRRPTHSHQLCLRCGRHEVAGSYCTFCRTAEYDLADHKHVKAGAACPLGSYLDPLTTNRGAIRNHLAQRVPVWPEDVTIRNHPRSVGYIAATDPEVPLWHRYAMPLDRLAAPGGPGAVSTAYWQAKRAPVVTRSHRRASSGLSRGTTSPDPLHNPEPLPGEGSVWLRCRAFRDHYRHHRLDPVTGAWTCTLCQPEPGDPHPGEREVG